MKRILSLLLCLTMCVSLCPADVFAEEEVAAIEDETIVEEASELSAPQLEDSIEVPDTPPDEPEVEILSDVIEENEEPAPTEEPLCIIAPETELVVGETMQLSVNTSAPVTWSSSDENVLTVDESGLVTAIAIGNACIILNYYKANYELGELKVVFSVMPVDTSDSTNTSLDGAVTTQYTWLWPVVNNYTITSNFGYRTLNGDKYNKHKGIDIGCSIGTVVRAAKSGTVYQYCNKYGATESFESSDMSSFGNYVWMRNDDGTSSIYAHLSPQDMITSGHVNQGDRIALSGLSGTTYGAHLHFQCQATQNFSAWSNASTLINVMPTEDCISTLGLKINNSRYELPSDYPTVRSKYTFYGSSGSVPATPQNFTAKYRDNSSATLSWNASSGATSYQVQYLSPTSGAWKDDSDYTDKTATSYVMTGLGDYSSWRFRVRACNNAGYSEWNEITYDKYIPSGFYRIKSKLSGNPYMTVSSDNYPVISYNSSKVFRIEYLGNGFYSLGDISAVSSAAENNSGLYLATYNGYDWQQWAIIQDGDSYLIKSKVADTYIDVCNAGLNGETQLQLFQRNTAYNAQNWYFEPADGSIVSEGTCGDNLKWTLDKAGTFTISGTGAMNDYSTLLESDQPWNSNKNAIKKVVMAAGVTRIGNAAFYSCDNLESVELAEGIVEVGKSAFACCTNLNEIYLPSSINKIGDDAFDSCLCLTNINIPYGVETIAGQTFYGCTGLINITIPSSVKSIGWMAFYGCTSLKSIDFPDAFDGLNTIGINAFTWCKNLTRVKIPNSVTSIGDVAFHGCTALSDVEYTGTIAQWLQVTVGSNNECLTNVLSVYGYKPGYYGKCGDSIGWGLDNDGTLTISGTGEMYNYSSSSSRPWYSSRSSIKSAVIEDGVTSIGDYAFHNCTSLTSVTIGNSVTSIGNRAFYGCSGLSSVTIPDSVRSIGTSAFYECTSLASVTIGNGVTSIGNSAFFECSGLTSVVIPNSVTSIGNDAFYRCGSLTSVVIPNSVTSIGNDAFYRCGSLTSVTIGNGVTSIGEGAFFCCSSLTSIEIPDSVTSIGEGAFFYCTSLMGFKVNERNANYCDVDGVLFDKDVTKLIAYPNCHGADYVIPTGVTSIGNYAFGGCSSLSSVTIPNSVTSIDYYAFSCCSSLSSVTIPDSVRSIGDFAFYGCSGLTSVTIGNSVAIIGDYAFGYCSGLTSVVIPNSVTSIGSYAFSDCTSLTSVTIPNSVTSIGSYAFSDCTSLTSVTIPNSVTSIGYEAFSGCKSLTSVTIGNSVTSIGNAAFYECSSLTSVVIPNSVTSIGWYAFAGCSALSSVTIPNSVRSIGDYAFVYCTSLTSVTIPNSVTSIGYCAFYECSSLTSVTIGNSVTSIGDDAFYGCSSLTDVYYSGTEEQWRVISIDTGNECLTNTNIHYNYVPIIASGACGDAVNWVLEENGTLTVSGTGDMTAFEYNTQPWASYANAIQKVEVNSGVTSISSFAFLYCANLNSVILPDGLTQIGQSAFCGCTSLAEIAIPESVWIINNSAFSGCTSLKSVTLSKNVAMLAAFAFANCDSLGSINVNSENPEYKSVNGVVFTKDGTVLKVVPAGISGAFEIPTDVTTLEMGAFSGCKKLTEITVPSGVTRLGFLTFDGCTNLESISITDSVTAIETAAFQNCTGLKDIYYSGSELQWANVRIDTANDAALNAQVHFGQETISGICGDALTWTLSNDGTLTISGTGEMYDYSPELSDGVVESTAPWRDFAASITSVTIEEGVISIGDYAFYGLNEIKTVSIPSTVASIGVEVFDCQPIHVEMGHGSGIYEWMHLGNMTAINVAGDNQYYCSIDGVLFNKSATELIKYPSARSGSYVISSSVISVADNAFYGCHNLTEAAIPDSLASIGSNAFACCYNLNTVYYAGSETDWNHVEINSGNTLLTSAKFSYGLYTVTYELNGGDSEITSQTKTAGNPLTLSTFVPSRIGYVFVGWATESGSKTVVYHPGDEYTEDADITLHAVWKMPGDVNADGKVNTKDFVTLMRYCAGDTTVTHDPNALDIDNNGKVETLDFITLMQFIAGKDVQIY